MGLRPLPSDPRPPVLPSERSLLLALLLLIPAAAPADILDALVVASAAADIATTELALRQPGLVEGNPFLQTRGVRIGAKVLGTALVLVAAKQVERRGHRKLAKAMKIATILIWSGVAINNSLQKGRR